MHVGSYTGVGGVEQLVPTDIGRWSPGDPHLAIATHSCTASNSFVTHLCVHQHVQWLGLTNVDPHSIHTVVVLEFYIMRDYRQETYTN